MRSLTRDSIFPLPLSLAAGAGQALPHFYALKVPLLQIYRLRRDLWYVGLSSFLKFSRTSLQK